MKETLLHLEAFERYYAMGKQRSFVSLAGLCGVSEKTVARWSIAFDWQLRVEQRDIENGRRLQRMTDDTIIAAKAKYRKIVQAMLASFVTKFTEGKVELSSVSDLERLVKLDLFLMGEPDMRTEEVATEKGPTWEEIAREKGLDPEDVRRRAEEICERRRLAAAGNGHN